MQGAAVLVVGQMLRRFLRIVFVGTGIDPVVIFIVIVVMQDMGVVLRHMLGDEFQTVRAAAAHYVDEITLRSSNRLPRK